MEQAQTMRVTVCQLRATPELLDGDWDALVSHVRAARSDLVLLPEMPFFPWLYWRRAFDATLWEQSVAAHRRWLARLPELAPAAVTGTYPAPAPAAGGHTERRNIAFVWQPDGVASPPAGLRPAHEKYYLPDEDGFWEASWYGRGDGRFELIAWGPAQMGFLICTELWFMGHARTYGQAGVHLLLTPRATELRTVDKWLAGGRAAAVVAGAYALSSNHAGSSGPVSLGGQGWVIDPDGQVLAVTTPEQPFVTASVDLALAERAKGTYPRYVSA